VPRDTDEPHAFGLRTRLPLRVPGIGAKDARSTNPNSNRQIRTACALINFPSKASLLTDPRGTLDALKVDDDFDGLSRSPINSDPIRADGHASSPKFINAPVAEIGIPSAKAGKSHRAKEAPATTFTRARKRWR